MTNKSIWFCLYKLFFFFFFLSSCKDIGMRDPVCVVEPVGAMVILQQFFVGALQESQIFLVQASIPDVIQDGHLLKLAAVLVRGTGYRSFHGHMFGPPLSRRGQASFLKEKSFALSNLFLFKLQWSLQTEVRVSRFGAGAGKLTRLQLLHIHIFFKFLTTEYFRKMLGNRQNPHKDQNGGYMSTIWQTYEYYPTMQNCGKQFCGFIGQTVISQQPETWWNYRNSATF